VIISFSRRILLYVVDFHVHRIHSVKADSQMIMNGDELKICKKVAVTYFTSTIPALALKDYMKPPKILIQDSQYSRWRLYQALTSKIQI
jgi:hypothetical protein